MHSRYPDLTAPLIGMVFGHGGLQLRVKVSRHRRIRELFALPDFGPRFIELQPPDIFVRVLARRGVRRGAQVHADPMSFCVLEQVIDGEHEVAENGFEFVEGGGVGGVVLRCKDH